MSEYIVYESEGIEVADYSGAKHHVSRFDKREEIVRCSGCEHVSFDEFGIGWCDENCREVKPWDFCTWGERKTINKIDDSVIHDRFCSLFDRYIIDGIRAWGERKSEYLVGEIVRCRDCKFFKEEPPDDAGFCMYWVDRAIYHDADGFCAWGERREQ